MARAIVPLLGGLLLVPLVRPVFLQFLDAPAKMWGDGFEGAVMRAGLVVVAVLALDVYVALVRGPDRAVLDLHPVDPGQVASVQVLAVALERWWLVPLLSLLLVPIGLEADWSLWGLGVGVLCGSWILGLSASAMVHLLAIDAAESPRWEGMLELIRGSNPREQAAFIYAPGAVLGLCAILVAQAAAGAVDVWQGGLGGWFWLLLPPVVAAGAWSAVPGLARRSWFQASGILADIDARYATTMDEQEGRRVYLDWAVRFLLKWVAVWALKDLRHGWRGRRTWISGAWFGGIAAGLAGWSGADGAAGGATALAIGAVWLVASVGLLMERDEPEFLRVWLPDGGVQRRAARFWVLFAWLQACVWPPVLVLALRHGSGAALTALPALMAAAVFASLAAMTCSALRDRGLLVYAPIAALAAAAGAAQMVVVQG